MTRALFLTVVAGVATAVGLFATLAPGRLVASKGVAPDAAVHVWVREVGVLLVATGVAAFLVRNQPDSPTLRAFLVANVIVQIGLFPIELIAYARGVLTSMSGVIPNSVLHLGLAGAFTYYAVSMA